jgi:hypothetical protein
MFPVRFPGFPGSKQVIVNARIPGSFPHVLPLPHTPYKALARLL